MSAAYDARCWAEARTEEEIRAEIARCTEKARRHRYDWQEVGSAQWDWDRVDELETVIHERGER